MDDAFTKSRLDSLFLLIFVSFFIFEHRFVIVVVQSQNHGTFFNVNISANSSDKKSNPCYYEMLQKLLQTSY